MSETTAEVPSGLPDGIDPADLPNGFPVPDDPAPHPAPPDPAAVAALVPPGFVIGVGTAAIQIEGDAAGRGASVWDAFARRPGAIADGSTPDVAVDHIRRMSEDVALLRELGVDAYRFSISWPRVQPGGRGAGDPAGIAVYDRLVDALLEAGIRPMATLFHWDTPLELERRGGWLRRETAERFAEFAAIAGRALGDRVADWITVNEPVSVTLNGYALGIHAPGRTRLFRAIPVATNLLIGHGLAVQALRSVPVAGRIGMVNVHTTVEAATPEPRDRQMARLLDLLHNRLFADPVLRGTAPEVPDDLPAAMRVGLRALTRIRRRDLAIISQPIDFYGLNYYFPCRVAAGPDPAGDTPTGHADRMREVPFHFVPQPERPVTGFGWPVAPEGLTRVLGELRDRYGAGLPPVVVTESGASFPDPDPEGGVVDDPERTSYVGRHLEAAVRGAEGVDVQGFYVWTLMDNWEWAAGFTQRFGIVHVDRSTLARTPKRSFRWLQEVQRRRVRASAEG